MERPEEFQDKFDPIILKARTARFRMDMQDRQWLLPTAAMMTNSWFNFNMTELEFKEFIVRQLELRLEREMRRKIPKTDSKSSKISSSDIKRAIFAAKSSFRRKNKSPESK